MTLRSLKLSFAISESIPPESEKFWASLTKKTNEIFSVSRKFSPVFEKKRETLRKNAYLRQRITRILTDRSYIRPLISLWITDQKFLDMVSPTPELLNYVERLIASTPKKRLGLLALMEVCLFFFIRYDYLDKDLPGLCFFIREQLSLFKSDELPLGLKQFKAEEEFFLTQEGHSYLAKLAEQSQTPLVDVAQQYAIATEDARFFEASQHAYYIARMKKLPPNVKDDLLYEVQAEKVYMATTGKGRRMGHEVIEILIDTLIRTKQKPSDLWRDTILAIGSDPRVPETALTFRDWWVPMGEKRIQYMHAWLSEMDLAFFLKIFEEYVKRSNDATMRRMFPERSRFLRGLFKKDGIVRGSRLFLGKDAEEFLRDTIKEKNKLPFYVRISGDAKLAVFYLNLGKAHLVEGTHNFALTIMDKLPSRSPLQSYQHDVSRNELGKFLKKSYETEFGYTPDRFLRKKHHGKWIIDVFDMLKNLGIPVSESDIMDRKTYMESYR